MIGSYVRKLMVWGTLCSFWTTDTCISLEGILEVDQSLNEGMESANKQYNFFRVKVKIPKLFYSSAPNVVEIFDGELIVDEFVDDQ